MIERRGGRMYSSWTTRHAWRHDDDQWVVQWFGSAPVSQNTAAIAMYVADLIGEHGRFDSTDEPLAWRQLAAGCAQLQILPEQAFDLVLTH